VFEKSTEGGGQPLTSDLQSCVAGLREVKSALFGADVAYAVLTALGIYLTQIEKQQKSYFS